MILRLTINKLNSKHIERKIREVEAEIKNVGKEYSKFEENKERLEQQEGVSSELKAEINKILNLNPNSAYLSDQPIMYQLKASLENLLQIRNELTRELESTNSNVKGFINDMSALMTSHTLTNVTQGQTLEEECGGSSFYNDNQREENPRPSKKYTPHYHTATQGGSMV